MTREPRQLHPWEERCGCPTCKAKPHQPCVIVKPTRDYYAIHRGRPTAAHRARITLWIHLWGHTMGHHPK